MTVAVNPSVRRVAPFAVAVAGVGVSIALVHRTSDSPSWSDLRGLGIVASFFVVILMGEWFQLSAPNFRGSAPLATATAFGLALAVEIPAGSPVTYGTTFVVALTAVAMTLAAVCRRLTHHPVSLVESVGRFLAVTTVALLYRTVHLGQAPGEPAPADHLVPWQRALLLLAISFAGLAVDLLFTTLVRALARSTSWRRTVVQEARSSFVLSSALAVTGVLIALAAPPLGIAALPLFLAPLILTLFAFRRYVAIRATYLQSIRTLSRLTDAAGYTRAGHSERVAARSMAVARELGIPERELLDLEYAALLHDIGQVALVDPIPGGATVLAAPADQRRIEADTVAIIRETGVLEDVARILEHQTTPYRQMREFGEQIPLTSRIIKVVNAYEDLTAGARTSRARDAAIERIYLGLGYEYDPHVVDALLRVIGGPKRQA